jgi:hypothetical protein
MKGVALNSQVRMLVWMEIKQFFRHRRSRHFIPLVILGVWLVLWPHFASPFIPVILVLFTGLELQFHNIFFRTENELEALSILSSGWRQIVIAKNVAAIGIVCILFPILSASILYFSPSPISFGNVEGAISYVMTTMFPLIHIGNLRSIQHPRRVTGWQVDDLAGAVEILVSLGIFSIPFMIFMQGFNAPYLCILYFIATGIFWWRYSIPRTVQLIEAGKTTLCMTT